MGREVKISSSPKRIISTVPSQTELLHYLHLEDEVLGVTKFCTHPSNWQKSKERIGGTKNLNITKINSLKPDLIIGNKEENTKEDISELEKIAPVWMSDVNSFSDALDMIKKIGNITNRTKTASSLISNLIQLQKETIKKELNVIYLIWNEPMMCVGKDTFIDSMLSECGFINIIKKSRYPEISLQEINSLNPDLLLLSTEPYPFGNKHLTHFKTHLPNTKAMLVDGEMFSWYGSRLEFSFAYFKEIFKI